MSQTAAHLVDVVPGVPVRQWVLSPRILLRVLLAAQHELVTPVLQVVQRVVTRHLIMAVNLEWPVVQRIPTHLGLDPQPPPRGRAREAGQD